MEVSMLGSWKMLNLYVECRKLEESLRTRSILVTGSESAVRSRP